MLAQLLSSQRICQLPKLFNSEYYTISQIDYGKCVYNCYSAENRVVIITAVSAIAGLAAGSVLEIIRHWFAPPEMVFENLVVENDG